MSITALSQCCMYVCIVMMLRSSVKTSWTLLARRWAPRFWRSTKTILLILLLLLYWGLRWVIQCKLHVFLPVMRKRFDAALPVFHAFTALMLLVGWQEGHLAPKPPFMILNVSGLVRRVQPKVPYRYRASACPVRMLWIRTTGDWESRWQLAIQVELENGLNSVCMC